MMKLLRFGLPDGTAIVPLQLRCWILTLRRTALPSPWTSIASGAVATLLMAVALSAAVSRGIPSPLQNATIALTQEPITPIPSAPKVDQLKLALGEDLFRSALLSRDQTRSCLSCHDVGSNGADGVQHAIGADGKPLLFNTPTVFNAALSFRLHWQGDKRSLESQVVWALNSAPGLGSNIPDIIARLNADAKMVSRFVAAYGCIPDDASLIDALATYERSLVTPDSRFDRWLKGDKTALSAKEFNGYVLFKSFGCVSCHEGVNIGANLFQRHGIFHPLASPEPEILRVPSLRNVATTPPYFHDGSAATLPEAVRLMALAQLEQSLSEQEIDAIVAFLNSLTGNYRGVPVRAAAQ
jgi:cytochrome c peroxidase